MANNKENNVIRIDPIYIKYRKMWKENRWQFSGELVKLTIKQSKTGNLDDMETHMLNTMNRVIDENDGKWTEGYEWTEDGLNIIKPKKR